MCYYSNTASTENYTLSLHDALPICEDHRNEYFSEGVIEAIRTNLSQIGALRVISRTSVEQYRQSAKPAREIAREDRKSTRLNSSHSQNSYAVFCLKKKRAACRSCGS